MNSLHISNKGRSEEVQGHQHHCVVMLGSVSEEAYCGMFFLHKKKENNFKKI